LYWLIWLSPLVNSVMSTQVLTLLKPVNTFLKYFLSVTIMEKGHSTFAE
jgi:hypothetical protein